MQQIVIGLGTGRCGTQSLADLLSHQDSALVYHEKHLHTIAWQASEAKVDEFLQRCGSMGDLKLVGDVAFYYLPYVEYILERYPFVKFICMRRRRAPTVASYLQWTENKNHWVAHDGSVWDLDAWDHCYPKYTVSSKKVAIERYWDEYYATARTYRKKYPHAFRIFPMSALNGASGQYKILTFLGIPRQDCRLKVGVRLGASGPAWRRGLTILEKVRDFVFRRFAEQFR